MSPQKMNRTDEYQAGDGLEDGEHRDDDAGEPAGDTGEQNPAHQPNGKADSHGNQHINRVLTDGLDQIRAVCLKESHHLASPHRFSATDRATLVLVTMPAMVSSAFRTTT